MGKNKTKGILKTIGYCVLALAVAGLIGAGVGLISKNIDTIRDKLGINKPTEKPVEPVDPDKPLTYRVKFINGEKEEVQNVIAGKTMKAPAEPVKEGYQFDGWLYSGNLIEDVTTFKVNSDMTLRAKFSQLLNYQFNGSEIIKYEGTENIITLPNSYSLGKKISVTDGVYLNMQSLEQFINQVESEKYPLKLLSKDQQEIEIINIEKFTEFKTNFDNDMSIFSFPAEVIHLKQNYIVGEDIKVTSIGNGVFEEKDITSVEILEGITEIKYNAFKNCSNLSGVYLPNSLTVISESAFENCSKLSDVEFPNSLVAIKNRAFKNTSLRLVDLSDKVTLIGEDAFSDCASLWEFSLPENFVFNNGYVSFLKNCPELYKVVIKTDIENKAGLLQGTNSTKELMLYVPDENLREYISATQLEYRNIICNELSNNNTSNNPSLHSVIVAKGDGTAQGYVVEHRGKLPFLDDVVEGKELEGAYFLNKNSDPYFNGQPADDDILSRPLAWALDGYIVTENIVVYPRYAVIAEKQVLPYIFENGVLKKYLGNDERVVVPSSYSERAVNIEKSFESKQSLEEWLKSQLLEGSFKLIGTFNSDMKDEEYMLFSDFKDYKSGSNYLVDGQVTFNGKIKQFVEGSLNVVTTIGVSAFYGENAFDLKSVTLPATITNIENYAFDSRSLLEEINLENVVTIGDGAFMCTALKTVTFGANCQSIGSNVLGGTDVKKIIFKSENLPTIKGGINNLTDMSTPEFYIADEYYDNYVNNEECAGVLSRLHKLSELEEV